MLVRSLVVVLIVKSVVLPCSLMLHQRPALFFYFSALSGVLQSEVFVGPQGLIMSRLLMSLFQG